ncbi:hypothetical protein IJ531_02265, partial [bacterium]|nr:hypothetical protein [bacterium]
RGAINEIKDDDFDKMKCVGIKRIVELQRSPHHKNSSLEAGFEYFWFPTPLNIFENSAFITEDELKEIYAWRPSSKKKTSKEYYTRKQAQYNTDITPYKYVKEQWEQETRAFIERFIKYIQVLQKDNYYIGCEMGTFSTNLALMLNFFFNPLASKTPNCITPTTKRDLKKIISLYKNLTPGDKKRLNWDDDFDKNFEKRVKKYM